MNLFALLTALAQAAASWLQIQTVNAQYNLTRRIEADIEADENQITDLRVRSDDASQLLADRLRQRILRAQGIVAGLPAPSARAPSGPGGANAGGDLRPTNG